MLAVRPLLLLMLFFCAATSADHHRQAVATVVTVSSDHGNIDTDVGPAALEQLGLKPGDSFSVEAGERRFSVYLGETYSDVPRGDWIAFITAAGNLRIARNFESAASALGVKEGDSITLLN